MGSLTVATWNAAAVFSSVRSSQSNVRKRWSGLGALFTKCDVLCLQEVHGIDEDTNTLDKTFGGFLHFASYCENAASGGVVTSVSRRFAAKFEEVDLQVVLEGRVTILWCRRGGSRPIAVANVHLVPNLSTRRKKAVMRELAGTLTRQTVSWMAGDWNFPAAGELRTNLVTGMPVAAPNSLGEYFEEVFAGWAEVEQDRPTRRQMGDEQRVVGCSRIDRVYTNLPPLELLDRRATAATVRAYDDLKWPSDHLPVIAMLSPAPTSAPRRPLLPRWVVRHPEYKLMLAATLVEVGAFAAGDPFERLEEITACFHEAARRLKARRAEASTDGEVLHLLIAAARCWRVGARARIITMRRRCQLMCEVFDSEDALLDEEVLHGHIRRLSVSAIAAQIGELGGEANDRGDPAAVARRTSLHKKLAAWSPKRRRVCGLVILVADGEPIEGQELAAEAIRAHWDGVFSARASKIVLREVLLRKTVFSGGPAADRLRGVLCYHRGEARHCAWP